MFCSLSRIDLPSTFSSKTSRYDSVELEAAAGDIAVSVLWRSALASSDSDRTLRAARASEIDPGRCKRQPERQH